MAASRPAEGAPPGPTAGDATGGWVTGRKPALDNLKVLLIGTVIVIHGVMGYAGFFDGWPYADVQEVHLPDGVVIAVFALFAPVGLFMMALLFLVAGLLTTPSVDRKGAGRFARDRLLRLGVPFAVFVLLLWPGVLYAMYRGLDRTRAGYWAYFTQALPDNGPLWFVGFLLLLSLAYAGWRGVRRNAVRQVRPITIPALFAVAAVVAATSFLVRLAVSYGGPTPLDLNEWQWPECIALFAVGVLAAPHGWLAAVPGGLERVARRVTALTGGAVALFLLAALALGVPQENFLGGPHWAALVVATLEGLLTVFGSIWLLGVAQRRLNRWTANGPVLARSAYPAFILQSPVLIGLAMAVRPLPADAEVKATVVAVGGLALSFWLGRLIVARVRPASRVL
ncbi:MAG: acyltransferase family protein [Blastococcus sp.]